MAVDGGTAFKVTAREIKKVADLSNCPHYEILSSIDFRINHQDFFYQRKTDHDFLRANTEQYGSKQ